MFYNNIPHQYSSLSDFNSSSEITTIYQIDGIACKLKLRLFWEVYIIILFI